MNKRALFIYLILLVLILFIGEWFVGSVLYTPGEIFKSFRGEGSDVVNTILFSIRIPRSITAVLAGVSLSICGLMLQTLFRNPLAGPYVLGISSGASLGVAVAVMGVSAASIELFSAAGRVGVTLASVCGALISLLIVLAVSSNLRNNAGLLIVGVMLGFIFGAIQSVIEYLSSSENLKSFSIWGMGNLGNVGNDDLYYFVPLTLIGILYSLLLMKPLNALQLGEDYASSLGINVKNARYGIILSSGLLTGVCTAYCGPIAFIGIAIPHVCRIMLRTSDHRFLLPFSAFGGAAALLLCDIIAQLPGTGFIIPVNIVTSIVGAPLLIYLILRHRNE